jgi:hypothetical protein
MGRILDYLILAVCGALLVAVMLALLGWLDTMLSGPWCCMF